MATLADRFPGEVARLVRAYLRIRGMSANQLALRCGVDRSAISAILRGWNTGNANSSRALGIVARTADRSLLARIVEVLEIPEDEVMRAVGIDTGIITPANPARYLSWQNTGVSSPVGDRRLGEAA